MMKCSLVFVLIIAFGLGECQNVERNIRNQANFSKVRYLLSKPGREIQTIRPLFYWELGPIATTENKFSTTIANLSESSKKNIPKFFNKEGTILKTTQNINKHKKRHKKNRTNKTYDSDNSVLEIPKMAKNISNISAWKLKSDSSIQDVILKLNRNPETSHEKLLEKNKVKIAKGINTSPPYTDDFVINFNGSNTGVLLHDTHQNKLPEMHESSFNTPSYDFQLLNAHPPTESIFNHYAREDTILGDNENNSKRKYTVPKIHYPSTNKHLLHNISLANFMNEISKINHKLDSMQRNEIREFLRKMLNSSDDINKYGDFLCSGDNGGCAHFCVENNDVAFLTCECLDGFTLGSDRKSCIDNDECSINNGGCESFCHNTLGSYYCDCPFGLRIADDSKSCEDVNECLLRNGHGPCQDTCTNTFGSYFCGCSNHNGTLLALDKHSCEDVNECKEKGSGCSHGCIDTHGRSFCTCPEGLVLGSDWKTCNDINECELIEIKKRCNYGCLNTLGSYYCLEFDIEQNDQTPLDYVSCPPLFPPLHGFFHCSRKKSLTGGFKTKNGRTRLTNRPGTACELICPKGFKNVGEYKVLCGFDGEWTGESQGECSQLLGRTFDLHHNFIQVSWAFPKPKIKCPRSFSVYLKPRHDIAVVTFPPPKANVDWKYIEADPPSAKSLKAYLPRGHHWITFKAVHPYTQLNSKCIIYINVKKSII